MKKKILMVHPEFPATYWSFKHSLQFTGYKSVMPPLGLLTIAAMLPEEWDIKLVDMNVERLQKKYIKESDLVFISSMIVQKKSFQIVVDMCNNCGVPIAAGGAYPTSSHSEIEGVDYFILNEGEVTLPEFISDYINGKARMIYKSDIKPDISFTPVPRFDLIDMNKYVTMPLQYSRGCPYNCEFCDVIEMFGRVPRAKSPKQFLNEMDALKSAGYRGPIFIVDDNFIGNRMKVTELLNDISLWQDVNDHPFTLFTEVSINLAADDELLSLMVKAGFDTVFVGIETPDRETLSRTQKAHNIKLDLLESVKKIQKEGIEVQAGFILGFDSDRDDIFDRQVAFIQQAAIPVAMVGLLIALPGTQLYKRLEKEGRLTGSSSGNNTNDLELNYKTIMDRKKLINGYKKVLSEIYSPEKYFSRSLELVKRMPSQKRLPIKLNFRGDNLKAFIMSLFKQGLSSYGIHYIKFLVYSLYYNMHNFPFAVNTAIKGFHFFKITRHTLEIDDFSIKMNKTIQYFNEEMEKIYRTNGRAGMKLIDKYNLEIRKELKKTYRALGKELKKYASETYFTYIANADKIAAEWKNRFLQINQYE